MEKMHTALFDNNNEDNLFRNNPLWQSYVWSLVLISGWNMTRISTLGDHVRLPPRRHAPRHAHATSCTRPSHAPPGAQPAHATLARAAWHATVARDRRT